MSDLDLKLTNSASSSNWPSIVRFSLRRRVFTIFHLLVNGTTTVSLLNFATFFGTNLISQPPQKISITKTGPSSHMCQLVKLWIHYSFRLEGLLQNFQWPFIPGVCGRKGGKLTNKNCSTQTCKLQPLKSLLDDRKNHFHLFLLISPL